MISYRQRHRVKPITESREGAALRALPVPSATSSSKDSLSFACLTLYRRTTSLSFQTSQLGFA